MAKTKAKAAPKRKPTTEQRECIRLVKKARRDGWTLEDLAQHLGTSFSTVSRWAGDLNVPSRNTAARMITLLGAL